MEWMNEKGLRFGHFPSLAAIAPELVVRFVSRIGGHSSGPYRSMNLSDGVGDENENVTRNRDILLSAISTGKENIAWCGQVHGSEIRVVTEGGFYRDTDGLITETLGLALAISTADCLPVFIYYPPGKILAALHVGRAGAAGGIVEKAFDILYGRYDIDPFTTLAVIGPGICGDCYTVGKKEADIFPEECVVERSDGHHLDLGRFCEGRFREAGLRQANIFRSRVCTSCNEENCFSYRREKGTTGRHWTVGIIRESP